MFLTVLSAVALVVGGALTVHNLSDEQMTASQESAPVVEVRSLQSEEPPVDAPEQR